MICYIDFMELRFLHLLKNWQVAIVSIALYAGSMPASAQNLPENTNANSAAGLQEQAERTRIASERAGLLSAYQTQQQACYQKLAVTPCLTQARDEHNEKMRDLKRQEVALDDVQRKRKAAERMRIIDERNSPEAQLKEAERRGRAIEQAKQRESNRVEKEQEREAKKMDASAVSPIREEAAPKPAITAQGKSSKAAETKLPPEQRPGQAAKSAQSQQAAAQREKAAQERKEKAEQREAQRKKPASASLPVPP
jgi:colicin import membrane protein